jgi:aspartyl-tRNA(Asn)/glutamyl-tRNA(Gln) amidotransferase subunit A
VPDIGYAYTVLAAETYEYHAQMLADPAKRALYSPITLMRIESGKGVTAPDYIAARRRMTVARNTSDGLFKNVDVLVTPTFMQPPPTIAASLASPPDESVMIRNTLPFNVLGLPTISVPCGFTRAGLPIGLQITGPRLGEARVYALAHAYEHATEWHERGPALG